MKIAQIIPKFKLAGAERMCEVLSLELHKRGCDVLVISLYDYHSSITNNLEKNGVRVVYLKKKQGLDLSIYFKLIYVFFRYRPNVVHTHIHACRYAIPAAIITRINCRVHTVHNIAKKESSQKKLQNFFFHYCHTVPVAISPGIQESVQQYYNLKKEHVPMVVNGINVTKCTRKINYSQNKKGFQFLHVGRFTEQKNHKRLVDVFAKLHAKYPDTTLTLVGEGHLWHFVKKQVQAYHLEDVVLMPGKTDNVFSYYIHADAFILPSNYEGLPITILEAMGCGLPIIASDVGGIPDILTNNRTALLCSQDDNCILRMMERIYQDKDLRERLGRNARIASTHYSMERMTDGYQQIYLNTMK